MYYTYFMKEGVISIKLIRKINIKSLAINSSFFLLLFIFIMSTSSILREREKISFNYAFIPKTKDTTDYITYLNDYYQTDDIVGYLKINKDITTPVVQAEDNTYYLNHTIRREELVTGSIFLDYRNDINDKKLLIYGHSNNKYDIPFKYLKNYLDYDYFLNNKYITFITDKVYIYEIFSVFSVENDYQYSKLYFQSDDEYIEHLNYLKNNSMYKNSVDLNGDSHIITLQTCLNTKGSKLLIINGRKVN